MSIEDGSLYQSHAEHVEELELKLLREHEPLVDFRIVADPGLSEGRQSRVSLLEYDSHEQTHRLIWKRMGAYKGLTERETMSLQARLRPYMSSLESAGWRVPQLFYTQAVSMPGESQIFSYEQFIAGGDGEKTIANPDEPNFRKWWLIDEMLRTLYSYPDDSLERGKEAGQTVTKLPHGLDLKLANLVLEAGTNQLYFVDLFGPKELDEQGNWLSYSTKLDSLPEEALLAVCATREGTLLRCWRLAEQHWSRGGHEPGAIRKEFIAHLERLGPPAAELQLITREIKADYPWLDSIYEEYRV